MREAIAIRGLLAANDIDCFLQGENRRANLGVLGGYSELNILVRDADLTRSAALIGAKQADEPVGHRTAAPEAPGHPPLCLEHGAPGDLTCARCGRALCEECERLPADPDRPDAGVLCAECVNGDSKNPPPPSARAKKAFFWIFLAAMLGLALIIALVKIASLISGH